MIYSQNMSINALLSTKERLAILEHALYHPDEPINMNRMAKLLKLSPGQIHKYVEILRGEGLVEADRVQETPLAQSLRALLNTSRVEGADVDGILRKHFPKMKGWGLFGSWAAGTNFEGSDLDIWMKLEKEPPDLELARAKNEIAKKLGVQADLIAATPKRLDGFRQKSDAFYFALYNGKRMRGEGL
jgi:predicted nucleotidyltransferase